MPIRRHFIVIPTADDSVELSPMKEWLRHHPDQVPRGLDPRTNTSHELRAGLKRLGWELRISESDVRLIRPQDAARAAHIEEVLDGSADELAESEETERDGPSFALEYQLRDFIAENLATIQVGGLSLSLYRDDSGRDGVEYPTQVGPIDILARDKGGNFVVFELKRAGAPDRAIGQLARYMGWVRSTIGRERDVKGVIVARSIDERLRYAAVVMPSVQLMEYRVKFDLRGVRPAGDLAPPPG